MKPVLAAALGVCGAMLPVAAHSGSYFAMQDFLRSDSLPPFAIIHSPGYAGSGGVLTVRICVENTPASRPLVGPLQKALQMWNALVPRTGNCAGTCTVWEDASHPAGATDVMSTLLHELGHCAMGLGHPTLDEVAVGPSGSHTGICDVDNDGCCGERSSFTNSVDATNVAVVMGVRGDRLNSHTNKCPSGTPIMTVRGTCDGPGEFVCPVPANCCPDPPPPVPIQVQAFHWYRSADNDPVVVDSVVIDLNTYRRSPGTLPPGSSFAANANRLVATVLGYANTQAVMYPLDARARVFTGLTADDVNMVRYAKTGQDRTASTPDDYIVALRYQSSCTGAHVQARLASLGATANGRCFANAAWSYDQTGEPFAFHWTLIPLATNTFIELHVNTVPPNSAWDFGAHIFSGEGEAGDLREWDGIFP